MERVMVEREGSGQEPFKYSEAAMDQWQESRRRYIRPVLVFLPVMAVAYVKIHNMISVPILLVGTVVALVMVGQNGRIALRADRRLKAEKRDWEARQGRSS